jgi:hypothetical protein
MNLKVAALLCDEVRHNRPKFDICRQGFFGDLATWKSNFSLHLSIDLNFRHTSKKIKGGTPKKILEKKNVFPKKYVELGTFDGTYYVQSNRYSNSLQGPQKGAVLRNIRRSQSQSLPMQIAYQELWLHDWHKVQTFFLSVAHPCLVWRGWIRLTEWCGEDILLIAHVGANTKPNLVTAPPCHSLLIQLYDQITTRWLMLGLPKNILTIRCLYIKCF